MEDKINVNYILDSQGARLERTNKRLFILTVILTIILFVTNSLWAVDELQTTDEISVEQEVDTGEGNTYLNGIGDFNYGESEAKDN